MAAAVQGRCRLQFILLADLAQWWLIALVAKALF
jgi:hypothetical protein